MTHDATKGPATSAGLAAAQVVPVRDLRRFQAGEVASLGLMKPPPDPRPPSKRSPASR